MAIHPKDRIKGAGVVNRPTLRSIANFFLRLQPIVQSEPVDPTPLLIQLVGAQTNMLLNVLELRTKFEKEKLDVFRWHTQAIG